MARRRRPQDQPISRLVYDVSPEWNPRDSRRHLTDAERVDLALAAQRGDHKARDRLVLGDLPLIISVACKYKNLGMEMDDLIGEAVHGFLRAIDRYKAKLNVRFLTYAMFYVRGSIKNALYIYPHCVQVPYRVSKILSRWRRAWRVLQRELGREPEPDEVQAFLGLSKRQRDFVDHALIVRRLGEDLSFVDILGDDEIPQHHAEMEDELAKLNRRLDRLDMKERTIVALRFGLGGHPPRDRVAVGKVLGVDPEWIRRLERKAIAKMKADDED